MSTMTADCPETGEARRILAEASAAPLESAEARAVTGYARDCLLEELDIRARLLHGDLDPWLLLEPDMAWQDPLAAALAIAGDRCLEAAKALQARVRENRRRENKTAAHASGRGKREQS